ncbi:hypothetical protein [Desulfatiferula olefinivorans]
MKDKRLHKKVIDKLGRMFAMLFNRAAMYNMNHPFTTQAMADFFKAVSVELKQYSPIVIIMHQDAFFVEDEPLDPRLNVSKMLMHFKKGGIQSVSLEEGLTQPELETFFSVFIDQIRYPSAESMKEACDREGVLRVKINHVFFKKVTADEEVLSRDEIKQIADTKKQEKSKSLKEELLDMISGGLAIEELGRALPLTDLLAKPDKVSDYLNAPDTLRMDGGVSDSSAGVIMFDQIHRIRMEVDKAAGHASGASLHELAESVARMRDELVKGILERKKEGLIYDNEQAIMDEAKEMVDKVLLELVKDEYKQGATPIKRLAQVLRRLIPDNDELQRLLPKLKELLLAEGMSLSDFLKLTEELEREITNASLSTALKKSAEEIGVAGEDLLKEISSNPTEAAELIYLAAELRKETGDKKALTDVLVNYIERISGNAALTSTRKGDDAGVAHLKTVICHVESEIMDRLKGKDLDAGVLDSVAKKLNDRMDQFLEKMEVSFSKRQSAMGTWDAETTSLMKMFEEQLGDKDQIRGLLERVRDRFRDKKTGEIRFEDIRFDQDEGKGEGTPEEPAKASPLPKGVHSRKSILYFIEKEMARSVRYQTPFSLVTLSILKAVPQQKFAAGSITREEITYMVLQNLSTLVRDTDVVGVLDSKKIISLLPMTDADDARLALRRILKTIHSNLIRVKGVPLEVRFAGAVTSFEKDVTPTLKDVIRMAEHDIFDMVQRIKNLQTLY